VEGEVVERVEATFRHFYQTCPLLPELYLHVSEAELRVRLAHEAEVMVAQLTAMVAGERVDEIKYPLDWWEAFKGRWFPVWALRRWPVRFNTWKLDIHYPKLAVRRDGVFRLYNSRSSTGYPHYEDRAEGDEFTG
jgi:hypothetical protein